MKGFKAHDSRQEINENVNQTWELDAAPVRAGDSRGHGGTQGRQGREIGGHGEVRAGDSRRDTGTTGCSPGDTGGHGGDTEESEPGDWGTQGVRCEERRAVQFLKPEPKRLQAGRANVHPDRPVTPKTKGKRTQQTPFVGGGQHSHGELTLQQHASHRRQDAFTLQTGRSRQPDAGV